MQSNISPVVVAGNFEFTITLVADQFVKDPWTRRSPNELVPHCCRVNANRAGTRSAERSSMEHLIDSIAVGHEIVVGARLEFMFLDRSGAGIPAQNRIIVTSRTQRFGFVKVIHGLTKPTIGG